MTVFYRSGKIHAVIQYLTPAVEPGEATCDIAIMGRPNYVMFAWADTDGNPVNGAEVKVGSAPTEAEIKVAESQMSERKRVKEAFKLT